MNDGKHSSGKDFWRYLSGDLEYRRYINERDFDERKRQRDRDQQEADARGRDDYSKGRER